MASTALAVTEYELPEGAIQKPGYDFTASNYVNWRGDIRVAEQMSRFDASYVAVNDEIPSQMIIVAPKYGNTGYESINAANIESAAWNFLSANQLAPVGIKLELQSSKFTMNRVWFVKFAKTIDGARIIDAGIGMAISPQGRVNLLWGDLTMSAAISSDISVSENAALEIADDGLAGVIDGKEYQGLAIMPIFGDGGASYYPVHQIIVKSSEPYAVWETFVNAQTGEILQRTNKVYFDNVTGTVSGSIQPLYPFDPWEDRNFFHHDLIFDGGPVATTDMNGGYSLNLSGSNPVSVDAYLRGPYMEVWNDAGEEAHIVDTVDPPATYNVYWNESNSTPPERDAWYSAVYVHNWVKTLDPGLTVMDFPMHCNVYVSGTCNAFYSGWDMSINFFSAGGGCNNTAQIADVVYHEYGHGVSDLQTRPNGPNGAMHEGFSDYLACTITNQPVVGRGFYSGDPNGSLRTLDNNRRFPMNWNGEPHNDGLIIGGALWHTRADLSPHAIGYVDSLWHFARNAQTQEFEPYFWALLELDDNDGDLSNGTPNAWTIFHNFGDRHGIGPGTAITVTADTLFDSEDTTRSFTINASVTTIFNINPDSIILFYDSGSGFQPVPMTLNGTEWRGVIPPQPNDTHVRYYVLAVDAGRFRGTWPIDAPESYYSFYVGPDRIPPTLAILEGPRNTINLFGPYGPFIMRAFDVNGINSSQVRLHYFVNDEPEATASLMSGANDGEYILLSVDLDRQLSTGDTLRYYFTAADGARQPNTGRLPQSGTFGFAMTTSEVFEYFERDGLANWTYDQGWTLRNDGYISYHSVWFASPNYPNNANASLMSNTTFDLSPYGAGRVSFYTRGGIRSNDSCLVEVSNNNGQSWFKAGSITGEQISGYHFKEYDISSILRPNAHQYRFQLRFVTDSDSTWIGLIFDDIAWTVEPLVSVAEGAPMPQRLALGQNYPNPFNPATNISFSLPQQSQVRLEVFDILGRSVTTLINKELNAGSYSAIWAGDDRSGAQVSSGVYFYRLTTEQGTRQEKMTLLR
jgi:Zn-dependent metalloprotease